MGCAASKGHDSPIVTLCRERKDLMRNAADLRFILSSSHAAYFQALDSTGTAIDRFLLEEFAAHSSSSPSSDAPSSSPVLTIPSSECKHQKSTSTSGDTSTETGGVGGTSPSPSSLSHSLSLEDSNPRTASDADAQEIPREASDRESYQSYPVYQSYYSMWQSSASTATIYEVPEPEYNSWAGHGYAGDPSSSSYNAPHMPSTPPPRPPPTPPPPEASAWDFLNPFDLSQQNYSSRRYGSITGSPSSTDVREREGIPDLEDETESEPAREPNRTRRMRERNARKNAPPSSNSKPAPKPGRGSNSGSRSKTSGKESKGKSSSEGDEKKKEVSFEEETSASTEKSVTNLETGLSAAPVAKSVAEVAKEIKDQFRLASISGNKVSAVLDVGLPQYRAPNVIDRVICSRISDAFSALMHSCSSNEQPESSLRFAEAWYGRSGNRSSSRCGNLSSTLERLAVWETKLYDEVKKEEKLRSMYEKQCKRLKRLDETGAESVKIEAAEASVIKLLVEIDVVIRSIGSISSRIHQLRDEDLHPRITQLIKSSIVMWKCLLDCHRKQYMAVIQCRSRNLRAKSAFRNGSAVEVTRELEVELVNWLYCFRYWVNAQRHCFFILNEWLRRCIFVDPEETPDGAPPYSPGRVGAPPSFVVFNDLAEAMEKVSDHRAAAAMDACAAKVQALWFTQDAAQRRRQRAENVSKELVDKLRHWAGPRRGSSRDSGDTTFKLMNKMLEEEKLRHREAVKQVKHVARSSLQNGLIPVFYELGNFAAEMLEAYQEVRIPPAPGNR